jgi:hypothetical protein
MAAKIRSDITPSATAGNAASSALHPATGAAISLFRWYYVWPPFLKKTEDARALRVG